MKKSPECIMVFKDFSSRLGLIILFTLLILKGFAQEGANLNYSYLNKYITLTAKDKPITKVIDQLNVMIPINIIYNPQTITSNRKISFSVTNETFKKFLDTYFVPLGIYYKCYPKGIIFYHNTSEVPNLEQEKKTRLYMLSPKAIGE